MPSDPKTLLQIYHRWDYHDYAFLWHSLTAEQKQQWETNARRLKITGFNYWMRTRLNNLTNLCLRYRFDEQAGNVASDSSKNNLDGTLFGPSHIDFDYSRALRFDGTDDYVQRATADPLVLAISDFTLITRFRTSKVGAGNQVIFKKRAGAKWYTFYLANGGEGRLELSAGDNLWGSTNACDGAIHTIALLRDYTNNTGQVILDGIDDTSHIVGNMNIDVTNAADLIIGRYGSGSETFDGDLDAIYIYDRLLPIALIKIMSERRPW